MWHRSGDQLINLQEDLNYLGVKWSNVRHREAENLNCELVAGRSPILKPLKLQIAGEIKRDANQAELKSRRRRLRRQRTSTLPIWVYSI